MKFHRSYKSVNKLFLFLLCTVFLIGLVSGACSSGLHSFKAYAVDLAGNVNSTETRWFFVDLQPPTMNITSPANSSTIGVDSFTLNYTYKDCAVWLDVNNKPITNDWGCWYSINGGSNITVPCNLSDGDDDNNVTIYNLSQSSISGLSEGENEIILYGQDGAGNIGSSIITLDLDTTAPTGGHDSPADNIHTSEDQNYSGTFSDVSGIKNVTLYIFDIISGLVYSETWTFGDNPLTVSVGAVVHLADGVYNWFFSVFDIYDNELITDNRTIIIDTINPDVIWVNPPEVSGSNPTNISAFNLSANVTDSYLDAINLTVKNQSGSEYYSNFTDGITENNIILGDNFTLQEGNNTIEICGRDSLSESPTISNTADFRKVSETKTTFKIDNKKTISRDIKIIDYLGKEVPHTNFKLKSVESWIDNGEHYKTEWNLDALPSGYYLEVRLINNNGEMNLLTDRGVTRIVDGDRNYYWRFDDIPAKDFKVEYKQDGRDVVIKIIRVGKTISKWVIDPIVGGLNNYCENKTVLLDTITPIVIIGKPNNNRDFPNFISSVLIEANFTSSDTNLETCWYEVVGPHPISYTPLTCSSEFSFVLINSGSYTLNLYSNDSANNLGSDSIAFTVTPYSGPRTGQNPGGGGGAGDSDIDRHYDRDILCGETYQFFKGRKIVNNGYTYTDEEYSNLKNLLEIKMGFAIEGQVLKDFLSNFRGHCSSFLDASPDYTDEDSADGEDQEEGSNGGMIVLIFAIIIIVALAVVLIMREVNIRTAWLTMIYQKMKGENYNVE